jgi:hypothetical protein
MEPEASTPVPRVVAWEVTRACGLACVHCRAVAQPNPHPNQLTTQEGLKLIDDIASFSKPLLILTGGDPLMRPDLFQLAAHATERGLPVVVSPSGTQVNADIVARLKAAGVKAISVSIDGPNPEVHDSFRQVPGRIRRRYQKPRFRQKRRTAVPGEHHRMPAQYKLPGRNPCPGKKPGRHRVGRFHACTHRPRQGGDGAHPRTVREHSPLPIRHGRTQRDSNQSNLRAALLARGQTAGPARH